MPHLKVSEFPKILAISSGSCSDLIFLFNLSAMEITFKLLSSLVPVGKGAINFLAIMTSSN